MPTDAPNKEIGYVNQHSTFGWSLLDASAIMRHDEETAAFKWPRVIRSTRLMMNDSQLSALYAMTTLQIRNYWWGIDPNGADEEIVRGIAGDIGLPVQGEDSQYERSSTLGFDFPRHLYHALKTLIPGHTYFEIVGEVMDDGKWHLGRLAFRPPENTSDIKVHRDGSLKSLRQWGKDKGGNDIEIPAQFLAAYIWDAEDGDWIGRSMLRSCYRDWFAKDRVVRINVINLERGGGMPYVETDKPMTDPQLRALAEVANDWHVDSEGGPALPEGARLRIEKASAPDAIATIRYHDEAMARAWMAMFAMLGQTQTGSRALGSTFVDFFGLGQQAIAQGLVCDVFNNLIRRMVEWNYGKQDLLPRLVYEVPQDSVPVADVVSCVDKGIITVDDELEAAMRTGMSLPPKSDEADDAPSPQPVAEPVEARTHVRIDGRAVLAEVEQKFRRQPNAVEAAAGVDFDQLDAIYTDTVDELLAKWRDEVKPDQVAEIAAAIEDAGGDPQKIAAVTVATLGTAELEPVLRRAYGDGYESAQAEAEAQGVELGAPAKDDVDSFIEARTLSLAVGLATMLQTSATQRALNWSNTMTPAVVAGKVTEHLDGLKDAAAVDLIKGATQGALNTGRFDAIATATEDAEYYGSELLDASTCSACADNDGKQYESLEALREDYPAGYVECEGLDRCRGTGVALYTGGEP